MKNPKIVFMGTPEFAVPSLLALQQKYGIVAVVTVPDKPQGRGKKIKFSPIKEAAISLNLPVLQPVSLRDPDFINDLAAYKPDIIVVVAFRILPREVYTLPSICSFNIHASLLPKYRGAAPINWAIIKGEKETGLTSFILKEKVDTGDILIQKKISIPENATAGDLHDLMMPFAADLSIETCELLLNDNYKPLPQEDAIASPAPKLFSETCCIDWENENNCVRSYIQGMSPFPGAWTKFNECRLKILRAECACSTQLSPGEFLIEDGEFFIGCKSGVISIIELQIQGKKILNITDFLRGYRGPNRGFLKTNP